MRPHPSRLLLALLALLLTACQGLPIPILTFATAGPSPLPRPSGPTATPPPASLVSFTLRVPANTPPGSPPAVRILDEVGGTSLIVPLVDAGNNVWTGGTPATLGSVLRYRYVRSLPAPVEELTSDRQRVPYRLLLVEGQNQAVDDTVAAWDDTPFAGELGTVTGVVRNSNTGAGVMGVLVSAGGRLSLTAGDGRYSLFDLPAGAQRVTLLAPDGSLRPRQAVANLPAAQTVSLDLTSDDPNQVHITFVVRLPAGTDGAAPLRMAGNVLQLGDTFALAANGSAVAAARLPAMVPMADGRWMTRILLYEGSLLRYKYTLGDGVWNGELDSSGARRLRTLVVPRTDLIVEDSVDAWHSGTSASVTFNLTTPPETPPNDALTIQFRTDQWQPPVPLWRVGVNAWKFVLYNPTDMAGSVFYRYCRNFLCGAADDVATAGDGASGRFFTPTLLPQNLQDRVTGWRWLGIPAAASGVLPAVNVRPGFAAGVDLPDGRQPDDLPFILNTLRGLPLIGANWVSLAPRASLVRMRPAPAYADDLAQAPFLVDYTTIVDQAHNAGLRVALHPVTCAYTPYGACPYWQDAPYSLEFWNAWFAAYEQHLLTQATLAARAGADLLVVGDFKLRPALPGEPEAPPDAEQRWRNLLAQVRARYSGSLAFELLMGDAVWPSPPAFLDSVDVIRLFWWSPLSASSSPGLPEMTTRAGEYLDAQVLPLYQRFGKPIQLHAAYLAADGAATQCLKRTDGQCHNYRDFDPNGDIGTYGLDLAEQADLYTALLTALNDRPWVAGLSAYGYHPVATLLDKSISVRGKPAEAVLAAWFPRLQGR